MNKIRFHFLVACSLTRRLHLKKYILHILKREKRPVDSIQIIFCSDAYLLDLNQRFLNHDFYTDILSFPLSKGSAPLIAEIYISIDRVRDNAGNAGTPFKEELHRVIFHGILHFCGYMDKTKAQILKMRSLEDACLKSYFNKFQTY